ncbi:UNVERIFIED_CONTAM: F-box/LRR-repeat protein 12 [Sesamum radiatum]|uniref:F-box/LRR-repeat protein 12 n=1 Tax=Sesamum radiatum TaxID=300843 RepID=A0AAW2W700_SESRA
MENGLRHPFTSILQLPDDCLYFIFQRLESSNDRESFGLTCHRWLRIQNLSRRSLQFQCSFTQVNPTSLSLPSTTINSFHLFRLLCRFPQLESLSLSRCIELQDSGLSLLLTFGLKLESLHLDYCYGITDHGLSFVAGGCPLLTTISLYRCKVTDIGLETLSQSCSTLKDVNVSFCSFISDHGIRALSQNCRHLTSINISHCGNVTGVGFQGCSQTLAHLQADSCKLEPEGILAILSGGGLEFLNISNLKSCIHGHGLATIDVGYISKLRVLNFRLWTTIGDDAIAKIARGCPLLEEWNLDYCFEIRISGWESIGSKCHNLERLHVNHCRNLCDRGLQALRDGCRLLRKLYLRRRYSISSTAIEMFRSLRSDVEIIDEAHRT